MVYRDHVWRRLDRVMNGIESIVRGRVPGFDAGGVGDRFLPEVRGGFRVDVSEDEDAIFVVADLPGFEQEKITICLLSPTNLWITSERSAEVGDEEKIVRSERAFGRMNRVVPLPHAATADGARASFTNGVLEVRLRKAEPERGERIPIE